MITSNTWVEPALQAQRSSLLVYFGPYCLDLKIGELKKHGIRIGLESQPMQILRLLVERRGEVVTREEVRTLLWPDNFVIDADDALSTAIRKVRVALCDSAGKPHYVETVPKCGYRFIAEVGYPKATPLVVMETKSPPAPPADIPRERLWLRWGLAAGLVLVALGVAGGRWWSESNAAPAVLGYVQLTHDGRSKYHLLTDGVRLYFDEIDGTVQLSVTGGESVPLWKGFALLAISPAGEQLLESPLASTTESEHPLYSIRLPNGTPHPLGLQGHAGAWSPNGEKLLYAHGSNLYLAGKEGGEAKRLLTAPGRTDMLTWSPDGTRILFAVIGAKGDRSLWEIPADGGRMRAVASPFGYSTGGWNGGWTPDGRYLIFSLQQENLDTLWALRQSRNIMGQREEKPFRLTDGVIAFEYPILSRDGKTIFAVGTVNRVELMHYQPKTHSFSSYLPGLPADSLAFSPRGDSVAWVKIPEGTLWRSRMDGSERIQLTSTNLADVHAPRWSPDGNTIAFAGRPAGKTQHLRLYRVPAGGGTAEELLPASFDQSNPNWSPDGLSLFLGSAPWEYGFAPGASVIRRLDLRTRAVTELPGSQDLWSPKLSPDGRFLLAETLDSRSIKLYDLGTETWTGLATMDRVIGYPCWTSDSKSVYFNTVTTETQPPAVYRVDRHDRKPRLVANLNGFSVAGTFGQWFGLAPDDSFLFLRDASIHDIYALSVRLP